jgi:hypothetical protein
LKRQLVEKNRPRLSVLLLPYPLTLETKAFQPVPRDLKPAVRMDDSYGFFSYETLPEGNGREAAIDNFTTRVKGLVRAAKDELADGSKVDILVFPEASLALDQFQRLQEGLRTMESSPSILIAGVRESQDELKKEQVGRSIEAPRLDFPRNAVYCQYLDVGNDQQARASYYKKPESKRLITPKYKQYKHHRWQLESSQIRRYGLSSVLSPDKTWWESIDIPKRRVSLLNVGDTMTLSHLVCEDLARQDPIAELIRQVGPTLVVTILLDGPQLRTRWSSRYATVFSDDPGSSVITLTSLGMVRRHSSEFGLMSRVVALWNERGGGHSREIELAQGAEGVLLTLRMDLTPEKTADGRTEKVETSTLSLVEVIQIYPGAD